MRSAACSDAHPPEPLNESAVYPYNVDVARSVRMSHEATLAHSRPDAGSRTAPFGNGPAGAVSPDAGVSPAARGSAARFAVRLPDEKPGHTADQLRHGRTGSRGRQLLPSGQQSDMPHRRPLRRALAEHL